MKLNLLTAINMNFNLSQNIIATQEAHSLVENLLDENRVLEEYSAGEVKILNYE